MRKKISAADSQTMLLKNVERQRAQRDAEEVAYEKKTGDNKTIAWSQEEALYQLLPSVNAIQDYVGHQQKTTQYNLLLLFVPVARRCCRATRARANPYAAAQMLDDHIKSS
jgi:hypothetical protein